MYKAITSANLHYTTGALFTSRKMENTSFIITRESHVPTDIGKFSINLGENTQRYLIIEIEVARLETVGRKVTGPGHGIQVNG